MYRHKARTSKARPYDIENIREADTLPYILNNKEANINMQTKKASIGDAFVCI